jgi:hypothetical protein
VLLFDLLKACMGNPSPRLLTRMLEDSKRKQEEKVANVDLFARLNYFGQSSDQIRARARATTACSISSEASIGDSSTLPHDLDELRQLIRGTSQDGSKSPMRSSVIVKDAGGTRPNGQILKPSQMIQVTGTSSQSSGSLLKRYASSKAPSMEMITEDNDEEEDEEDEEDDDELGEREEDEEEDEDHSIDPNGEDDERKRQESIRKFVQARFSGRESGSNLSAVVPNSRTVTRTPSFVSADDDKDSPPSPPLPETIPSTSLMRTFPTVTLAPTMTVDTSSPVPNPTFVPKPRVSKRISMHCVHPKLLEKICQEWMDSVPWKVCLISPSRCDRSFRCQSLFATKEPSRPHDSKDQGRVSSQRTFA